jgi:hypothetical protein|tara:strand:+ start:18367 stop:18579 length:213 start_codon:yes stop_codon:yes gene_type:complete
MVFLSGDEFKDYVESIPDEVFMEAYAEFRQKLRSAIFPFYPNNPGIGDDEIISVVEDLVKHWKDTENSNT